MVGSYTVITSKARIMKSMKLECLCYELISYTY